MKRRTLDIVFSIGGLVFGLLLLVLGLVLTNQSNFAKDYVKDQLGEQKITFTAADQLSEEEAASACLVKYAGTPLDSGAKAECYANDYIALHMREAASGAGYEGATYATLGGVQFGLKDDLQAAKDAGNPTDEIQAKLDAVTGLRETMFKGDTLRGLLLTTYGFSIFGERAALAATIVYIFAAVMVLLSIAGLIHAFTTKKDEKVLFVAHENAKEPQLV
ncbi:MAG: hypothetical protein U0Q03_09530 [Acidimicrobiales bacterium]